MNDMRTISKRRKDHTGTRKDPKEERTKNHTRPHQEPNKRNNRNTKQSDGRKTSKPKSRST